MPSRHPDASRTWIAAMLAIQAIDWVVTVKYLALGIVSFAQISTASFLPVLFVVGLLVSFPRSSNGGQD